MEELQFLETLNERGTLYLIRQPSTGRILTGRRVPAPQQKIYQTLAQNPVDHVPRVRAVQHEPDGQFLVLQDYVSGITLEALLARGQLLPQQAAQVGMQLCRALDGLHRQGIIHRDIKPANVLRTAEGQVWLIDFDIARTHKQAPVRDTVLLGTPGYAAPEQFGFRQTDARADLYAVGVLLNQLVTGAFPQEQLAPAPLGEIVRRCTALEPAQRYADAAALHRALAQSFPDGDLRPEAQPGGPLGTRWGGVPGFRRGDPRRMLMAIGLYGVALLFGAALVAVSLESLSNFMVGMPLLAMAVGCYLFWFDVAGLRSHWAPLERYRGTRWYKPYCVCLMVLWLAAWTLVMFFGVLVAEKLTALWSAL